MLKNKYILLTTLSILFLFIWSLYFFYKDFIKLEVMFEHINELNYYIAKNIFKSLLIYIFFYTLLVVCNFPMGSILSLIGGFLFGTWIGFLGVLIGATLGAFLIFLIAKFFFHEFIKKKILNKYPLILNYFNNNQLELMLIIRLIPGIPFFIQNLILAGLGANNTKYFFTTLLGISPWTFVLTSIGDGLDMILFKKIDISLSLFLEPKYIIPILVTILLLLVILLLKKKLKKFI